MKIVELLKDILQEQKLDERSFYSFDDDDILNKKTIDDYMYEDSVENYLELYMDQEGLEDEDEDSVRESEEFKKFIRDLLEDNLYNAKRDISDSFDSQGNFEIYRAITVDDNWLQHLATKGKRLGIYWSWDSDGAETHWGDSSKKNVAIIEAIINEKHVDWEDTFRLNMDLSLGDEKEIRLFKNTPIKIESIILNDKYVDISRLDGKVFYA